MLVLSRKRSERIELSNGVALTVVDIRGDKVRIGIDAPQDVVILREELKGRPTQQARDPNAGPNAEQVLTNGHAAHAAVA